MIRQTLKSVVLGNRAGARAYGAVQERWFDATYRRRRERYEALVVNDAGAHRADAHLARALEKIRARRSATAARAIGEVHTFACVPSHWPHQNQIVQGLARLGPVSRFDYATSGFSLNELRSATPNAPARREALLAQIWKSIEEAHRKRPIDLLFCYSLGWDMSAQLIRDVQEKLGIICVNISLDDKNWWDEIERGDSASALKNIAPAFDLCWTSASSVLPWYWAEGGQAIFLPEGVNTDVFAPMEIEQDIPIGFVGNRFGYRPEILAALKRAGIDVVIRGTNWPTGPLDDKEMLRFFNRCRINLGLGDMHYSRWLTNLKGRDFEVPAVGRGLYLTTYNSDLATCFHIDREIQCYRGIDELIETARHALRNPEECAEMAKRARERCVAEHQWQHRYLFLLRKLGIVSS